KARGGPSLKARGLGRVYRRGSRWWVQYSWRGKLKRESSGSKVRRNAAQLLRRRQAEMGQGRLVGPQVEKTTFEELATMLTDDYVVNGRKSLDRAKRGVAHLRRAFGHDRAIDITRDRVTAYIRSRLDHAQRATVRFEVAMLRRMFTLAVQADKASHRPLFPSIE